MIWLILTMGFLNLGFGVVLAMTWGIGPPTLATLWESLGQIPDAHDVTEAAPERVAESGMANLTSAAVPRVQLAQTESAGAGGASDSTKNPFLEQTVLDEVRALGDTLASA